MPKKIIFLPFRPSFPTGENSVACAGAVVWVDSVVPLDDCVAPQAVSVDAQIVITKIVARNRFIFANPFFDLVVLLYCPEAKCKEYEKRCLHILKDVLKSYRGDDMELLQLRYFYDCARLGSITKTAEKYMVPASSVSASIRRLEAELGNKLFDRTSNRIVLNENGKRLEKSLDKVFSELDQTVTDITCPTDDKRIKLLVRSMREKATEYVIEYRKKHPNVLFELVIAFDDEDFSDYDVIIDMYSDRYSDYDWLELSRERVRFCTTADHPFAGRELTLKQLKDQNFVTMGGNIHALIEKACNDAGFSPKVVAKINDITCYRKLLRSGIAIGYRRRLDDDPGEGLCYLNVTDFEVIERMGVYYKKDIDGTVKNFVEYLRAKSN